MAKILQFGVNCRPKYRWRQTAFGKVQKLYFNATQAALECDSDKNKKAQLTLANPRDAKRWKNSSISKL